MFEVYRFNEYEMLAFLLVLIRVTSCFVAWPLFSTAPIPNSAKVLISMTLSLALFPTVGWQHLGVGLSSNWILWLAAKEAVVGVAIGSLARFFFYTLSVCGEIVSASIGLSSDSMLNPTTGTRVTDMEQFYSLLGALMFLALRGHHFLIESLAKSFELVPMQMQGLNLNGFAQPISVGAEVLLIGIKLAAPVLVTIFFVNVAMAIVSRAVPQMNVFMTSLPINILVGLFVAIVSIPLLVDGLNEILRDLGTEVFEFMKAI